VNAFPVSDERRQRAYRCAAALGRWEHVVIPLAGWALLTPLAVVAGRGRIDWWAALGLVPFVSALLSGVVMGSWRARIYRREDADLARVPYDAMRTVAHWMYARLSVSSDAPCVFERPARIWLARGELDLPEGPFRRQLSSRDVTKLVTLFPPLPARQMQENPRA
jgi:hypothetical protein